MATNGASGAGREAHHAIALLVYATYTVVNMARQQAPVGRFAVAADAATAAPRAAFSSRRRHRIHRRRRCWQTVFQPAFVLEHPAEVAARSLLSRHVVGLASDVGRTTRLGLMQITVVSTATGAEETEWEGKMENEV